MRRALPVLLLAPLCCARAPHTPAPSPTPLVLQRSYLLSGPGDFQPSALATRGGRLFTVSDKANDLLEIELGAEAVIAGVAPAMEGPNLDLEGIAVDGAGDFLAVSEGLGRVLRVPANGSAPRWLELDLVGPARAAGLLATAGAGFEGVAVLGDRLVLAAEREPRGLVVARAGKVWAWSMERSALRLPRGRRPDFADLTVEGGRLYALVRNADAIVELVPAGDRFEEGRAWSFAATVAAHPYQDQRFGLAEGLAMDAGHVYVVLDNNGSPRLGAPADRRAMLFVFAKPPL